MPDVAMTHPAACLDEAQPQAAAEQPSQAAGQPEQAHTRLPNGSTTHEASPMEHVSEPSAAPPAVAYPKAGPPTSGASP